MEPLLPGLPFVGPSVRAISELASHVTMSADELGLRPTAPVLRRMLVAAAIPVEGYESHQVGAGYLDEEIFVPWIQHLSWGRLLEITATTAIDLPAPLAASRAFDPLGVAQLAQIVHLYRHGWFWSLDSAQLVRGRAGRLGR